MKQLLIFLFAAPCLTAVGQVPDYLNSSNPAMYFDFDGNAMESVNADEPLLPWGDIEYVESEERHVLELNGSGAHLYHPDASFPSFETVSMCIEVRLDEFGSGFSENLVPILSKWESTGTQNNEWTVFETDGQIWLWWTNSSNPGRAISFTHNWTAGEWHTICFEVGARAALWIDGNFVEEKIRDEFGSSSRLFRMGDWNNFQDPNYRTLNGAFDRLAIWFGLLTDNTSEAFYLGEVAVPGCMNPEACNYDSDANQDDGSCLACDVATALCGEGTAWDPESQTCIVANPSDSNFDGCVQLNDLLDLLSAYGDCDAEESLWQCGDPLGYQGYAYETVQIGEQCWFAENARYLPHVSPPSFGSENDEEAHAYVYDYYGSSPSEAQMHPNYIEYGALYNFQAMVDWQLCPVGWHVSNSSDWYTLVDNFGGLSEAGPALMSSSGWVFDNEGNGTNVSGFNGKPAGDRNVPYETFYSMGRYGFFWTSNPEGTGANIFILRSLGEGNAVAQMVYPADFGISVRCIKDTE
tara:strand:- start:11 stop:1579 length:1569 start_codon:yes stop_codon:yes gene_type:complete